MARTWEWVKNRRWVPASTTVPARSGGAGAAAEGDKGEDLGGGEEPPLGAGLDDVAVGVEGDEGGVAVAAHPLGGGGGDGAGPGEGAGGGGLPGQAPPGR